MANEPLPHDHGTAVAVLDQRFRSLHADVQSLASHLDTFSREVRDSITALSNAIGSMKQTDWKVVLQAGALVMTVAAVAAAIYLRDLSYHQDRTERQEQRVAKAFADMEAQHDKELKMLDRALSAEINAMRAGTGSCR